MDAVKWRVGCDIGGTFTDFFLIDDDGKAIHAEKRLTTPDDPSEAVLEGMRAFEAKVGQYLPALENFVHGTTLVINALIQRKGVRVGLLATEGFSDILEMRREVRYDSYDFFADFPEPLADRPDRLGVRERCLADGSVHVALDEAHARAQIAQLVDAGVDSFAVSLLHSYVNPSHEQRIRELILEAVPHAFVSLSSEVLPEIREFERTTATVANAYVQPLVSKYLDRMMSRLEEAGCSARVSLMLSNGGLSSVGTARAFPIRIVESGPAAGAMAAEFFSRELGLPDLLSFDMGGTTAKSVLVKGGRAAVSTDCEVARVHRFKKGSGIPLKLPFVDLMEIGAGGGSIARLSEMGLIQVGPDSAGSKPGPACYGRGGKNPTVTDANLLLGFLNADYFLGGEMDLDSGAAEDAMRRVIAGHLSISVTEAAWGVHDIVNERMASAAKIHLAEKGESPARLSMVAFGGAGPVHAVGLAKKLGITTVVIPPWAGVLSALGFFAAPISFDVISTYKTALADLDMATLQEMLQTMKGEVAKFLEAPASQVTFEIQLEVRYVGQGFEVSVPVPEGELGPTGKESIKGRFEAKYQDLYGRIYSDVDLELMNVHVTGLIPPRPFSLPTLPGKGSVEAACKGERMAFSPEDRKPIPYQVYERQHLPMGAKICGPSIIEERESTTIIERGMSAVVHEKGALILSLTP